MVYILKDSSGDRVNSKKSDSEEEAVVYFAAIKNLDIGELLKIFTVEPES